MKTAARWIAIIAIFTIPFLPLYVPNNLFFPYITGKAFAFRFLIEVAFAAYLLVCVLDKRYRPRFSWMLLAFGGLVTWMIVANLLGVNPHKAFWSNFERMDGWMTLIHIFALFLIAGPLLTVERLWRKWWLFFVSGAALVSVAGVIELIGAMQAHQASIRVATTLGNPIYLAVYLMFAILIAAWLAIESKGLLRYSLITFIGVAAVILFATGSRGPLIGLASGVASSTILWTLLAWRNRKNKTVSSGIKVAIASLIVVVVAAGALFSVRETAFVKENYLLDRAASVFSLSEELKIRSTIWGIALKGVTQDPLTGFGQEGFNQVFNKYYEPALYQQEAWFDRAHNMYIDWLVAGGVPALVLFVVLLVVGAISLLWSPERSRAERVLLASALIAYSVQALVVFDNLFSYVPLVMLFAMAHIARARSIPAFEKLPELRSEAAANAVGGVVAVATILVAWTVNVPNIRAANHLVYAVSPNQQGPHQNLALFKEALSDGSFATQEIREQLVTYAAETADIETVPVAIREELATFALNEMTKEIAVSPNDARLRAQFAVAYDTMGNTEDALAQIQHAIDLSPRKQVLHLSKAYRLYELGRLEEAKELYRYTYQLDPSFDQIAITSSAGLILAGNIEEGKELLLEAIGTTTPDSGSLFQAYYRTKQWKEPVAVAHARVLATNGDPEARYRYAQALAASGRFEEARLEIVLTMAEHPESKAEGEDLLKKMFPVR